MKRRLPGLAGLLGNPGSGQPWWAIIWAVGGLLFAIIVVGLVGLMVNQNVGVIANESLGTDVELDDRADDLRVAILDVRHYQRNIVFTGPSRQGIDEFERRYATLEQEIDRLEEIGAVDPADPEPQEFRTLAREYYATFRPAVVLYDAEEEDGGAAFSEASDQGLLMLDDLQEMALEIERRVEREAETALADITRAVDTERTVLLLVNGGLIFAGVVLAYAAVRMVGELRGLYAREREAAKALARASQAKTDFLADVSHELRTPLTVLRGNAELGQALGGDSTHAEIFDDIMKESDFMTRMVEDLLFLARSDSDSLPLHLEPVEAAPLLADLAGRAETLARQRGLRFRADLQGEGRLNADASRLEQALMVLLDNATKYSPAGTKVTLSSRVSGATLVSPGELQVVVADEGPGIPEEDLPRIFERFYRVDKARSRRKGGSGLGLSIASTIAQAHGGRIRAESKPGKGTRMIVTLPLVNSVGPEHYPAGAEVPAASPTTHK